MEIKEEVLNIVKDMLPEFDIDRDKIVIDKESGCFCTVVVNSSNIVEEHIRTMSVILLAITYELDVRVIPLRDETNSCMVFIFLYPVLLLPRE